jgi:hypothetical protein
VPNVTKLAIAAAATALALLAPSSGGAGHTKAVRCETLVSTEWTYLGRERVSRGLRYRVDAERLPCFVAVRLATQLIPLRTKEAFARARPPGYVCAALGVSANRYRPATAVGICLQKPVTRSPERSFSWRPLA